MYLAASRIGPMLYVLAGHGSLDPASAKNHFWRLDMDQPPEKAAWETLPALPGRPRIKAVMAAQLAADGAPRVYVFSGETVDRIAGELIRDYPADAYAFDPRSEQGAGQWRAIASPPRPVAAGSALAVGVRSVLLFSGSTGEHVGRLPIEQHPVFPASVLKYDARGDRWSEAGAMPLGVVTTAAVRDQERLILVSGETRPGVRTPRVQFARPESGESAAR